MSPMLPQQTGELFHRVDDKVAKIRSKARGTSMKEGGGAEEQTPIVWLRLTY